MNETLTRLAESAAINKGYHYDCDIDPAWSDAIEWLYNHLLESGGAEWDKQAAIDQAKHEDSDGYFGFLTGAEWQHAQDQAALAVQKEAYASVYKRCERLQSELDDTLAAASIHADEHRKCRAMCEKLAGALGDCRDEILGCGAHRTKDATDAAWSALAAYSEKECGG